MSGGVPGLLVTGRYRLVESIGQGGMGRVWRAADEILDRQVAIKEMRIDGLGAEDTRTRRERTLREARATARIDHPNVVRVYDVVDEGERLWIVMELVPGRSLERIVAEEGPLGPRDTARIGLALVTALRQVHARGVLHRDIKPGNVLVETGGRRTVLTDFGIAAIQDAKALTMVGMLVGSPDYMAPERISGRPQGPPSDVWSLGATLCAALGGRSPFSRDTTLATLHAVLYEEPELPVAAGPLRDILATLLAKDPTSRPDLDALERALRPTASPPSTPTLPVRGPELPGGVGGVELWAGEEGRPPAAGAEAAGQPGERAGVEFPRGGAEAAEQAGAEAGPESESAWVGAEAGGAPGVGAGEQDTDSGEFGQGTGSCTRPGPTRPPMPSATPAPQPPGRGSVPEAGPPLAQHEPGSGDAPTPAFPWAPRERPTPVFTAPPFAGTAYGPEQPGTVQDAVPEPHTTDEKRPAPVEPDPGAPAVSAPAAPATAEAPADTAPAPASPTGPAAVAAADGFDTGPSAGSVTGAGAAGDPRVGDVPGGPYVAGAPIGPVGDSALPEAASGATPAAAVGAEAASGATPAAAVGAEAAAQAKPAAGAGAEPGAGADPAAGAGADPAAGADPGAEREAAAGAKPAAAADAEPAPDVEAEPKADAAAATNDPACDFAAPGGATPSALSTPYASHPIGASTEGSSERRSELHSQPPARGAGVSAARPGGVSLARAQAVTEQRPAPGFRPHGPDSAHGPTAPTSPQGPHGPTGPDSPQGLTSQESPHGPHSPIGPHGPHGSTGPEGPHGLAGPEAPHGPIGPHGPQGSTGPEGPHGPIGPAGPEAPHGPIGPTGPEAPHGPHGPAGPEAPHGPIGPTGPEAPHGPAGPEGPHGPQSPRSPQGPPAMPAPRTQPSNPRTGPRRTVLVALVAGVVVVGGVIGVVLALPDGGGSHSGTAGGAKPSSSASSAAPSTEPSTGPSTAPSTGPSGTQAPTVQGTSRPPSLPPGAHWEAGGFAWATPKGWRRDVKTGAEVHYTSPDGKQELVAKSALARGDLMETWRTSEQNARQGQAYQKIRLERTTFRGHPAVIWDYTFTLGGTPWHARLLGFDADGKSYQINTWYQPDVERQALTTYDRVRDSFTVL
ncbi:protein kinase [Streptomyces sp. NPDC046197]|uniref:protein kinase domain-containing protein n=1 Tax=Streptomyces sp. NPDC046197 TaxID=3154337 RepID=UPI0033CCB381